MTALIVSKVTHAFADRKGVTALEYALVASAIAVVVVAAFSNFGGVISGILNTAVSTTP